MYKRPISHVFARGHQLTFGQQTWLMGILNCSPDSFSGDSKSLTNTAALIKRGVLLFRQGATIIDVGGESTRPGAKAVSVTLEIKRIIPVIKALTQHQGLLVSVDTYKHEVAKAALAAGACMVNHVKGTQITLPMIKTVKEYDAAIVLMHSRGNAMTMQSKTHYKSLIDDVIVELKVAIKKCLDLKIKKDKIIIDPGIGFAKDINQNYLLLNQMQRFHALGFPVLIGPSEKSFIGHVLGKEPGERHFGTAAAVTAAVIQGAHLVRVHDVAKMRDVVSIADKIINPYGK